MKRHNLSRRNDKVKFLNRLQKGMVTLSDLFPANFNIRVWRVHHNENNKTYENPKTGQRLSEADYKALIAKQGPAQVISISANKEAQP